MTNELDKQRIEKCDLCGSYMIPYGDIWLHPATKCKEQFWVSVNVTNPALQTDYEKRYGKPNKSYQEIIDNVKTVRARDRRWFNGQLEKIKTNNLNTLLESLPLSRTHKIIKYLKGLLK